MQSYWNDTDQQLLYAIQQDDECAFAELFKRYWKKAQAFAFSKVRSKELTEDIVQEFFTNLWDRRHSLFITNVSGYIYTGIKNSALNHIESSLVRQKYWSYYKQFIPESEKVTENTVGYHNLLEAIEQGLDTLPDKSKTVFYLNQLEGISVREIAGQLNLSEKAIQYHVTRSLKHLRVCLRSFTIFVLLLLTANFTG